MMKIIINNVRFSINMSMIFIMHVVLKIFFANYLTKKLFSSSESVVNATIDYNTSINIECLRVHFICLIPNDLFHINKFIPV